MEDAASHIYEAILHSRTDIVKILLNEVKTILKSRCDDNKKIEKEFDLFLNTKWDSTCTFLHQAVLKSQRDIIRALLQEGADPSLTCLSVNTEAGLEENALQAAVRLDKVSEVDPLHGISHAFEEMFFQATASSKYAQNIISYH